MIQIHLYFFKVKKLITRASPCREKNFGEISGLGSEDILKAVIRSDVIMRTSALQDPGLKPIWDRKNDVIETKHNKLTNPQTSSEGVLFSDKCRGNSLGQPNAGLGMEKLVFLIVHPGGFNLQNDGCPVSLSDFQG